MELTDDELKAMRARCSAVTPGPWEECGCSLVPPDEHQGHFDHLPPDWIEWTNNGSDYPNIDNDRKFFANSVTDLPKCLDEIQRLRESLARQSAEINRLSSELVVMEDRNNRGRVGWQIAKEANEAQQRYVKILEEENERLRQSTLSADVVREIRDVLEEASAILTNDGYGVTPTKIDRILSKLPPAQKEGVAT